MKRTKWDRMELWAFGAVLGRLDTGSVVLCFALGRNELTIRLTKGAK
ncbi:hypothetical protein ACH47B_06635 [Rhodococcus sp. NPDC019627]